MSFFRNLVLNYIRKNMSHEDTATRDAIFRAINEGMTKAFYEDNSCTRLNFTVLQVVKNGKDFHPYPYMGQTAYPDVEAMSKTAASAVREACEHDEKPLYTVLAQAKDVYNACTEVTHKQLVTKLVHELNISPQVASTYATLLRK